MKAKVFCRIGAVCLCICWIRVAAEAAPLHADDLLLIYNAHNKDSRELAEYYAKVRGVPSDRLLGLDLKTEAEEISADEFDRTIREPVRASLLQSGLRDRARCLVTFYGIPIRVGQRTLTPEQAKLQEKWRGQFEKGAKDFEAAVGQLDPTATRPASQPKDKSQDAEAEFRQLQDQYAKALTAAFNRIRPREATPEGQVEFKKVLLVIQRVQGPAGLLAQPGLQVQSSGADADQRVEALKRGVEADDQRISEAFSRGIEDKGREEARGLLLQNRGLGTWLLSLATDLTMLRTDETQAAVDSELALLWWDQYPKYRWVVNPMNWRYLAQQSPQQPRPQKPPVLMVSRIDGPTPAIARGLIDKAIAAEKTDLTGKVCIDARGMPLSKEGFGPYDESLRRLAGTIRTKTSLTVRLDNREALFGPGECPQTVLYCGWYSLRKYIDSFQFVPGAVGFHIASFEAISLKQPGEQGWCKGLLEKGITATLGPVAEPYLQSFPRPDDFFGLLLTGKFTLAEAYAYTTPFCSWMQMLIGDPLYRPFAQSPKLMLDQAVPAEIIPAEYRTTTKPG